MLFLIGVFLHSHNVVIRALAWNDIVWCTVWFPKCGQNDNLILVYLLLTRLNFTIIQHNNFLIWWLLVKMALFQPTQSSFSSSQEESVSVKVGSSLPSDELEDGDPIFDLSLILSNSGNGEKLLWLVETIFEKSFLCFGKHWFSSLSENIPTVFFKIITTYQILKIPSILEAFHHNLEKFFLWIRESLKMILICKYGCQTK